MSIDSINTLFMEIGMPLSMKGTKYITDCLLSIQEKEYLSFYELYEKVAKDNHTTYKNVEKCIRTAFQSCRDNPIDYKLVDKYLGYSRTSNAETLIHLYIKIKAKEESVLSDSNYVK